MDFLVAKEAAIQGHVPTRDIADFIINKFGPLPWRFMQAGGVVEVRDIGLQSEEYGNHVAYRTRAHVVFTWVGRGQGICSEDMSIGPMTLADPDPSHLDLYRRMPTNLGCY